jgi:MFS family permease
MVEFHIDKAQLSFLNSAYFWNYLLMQVSAGILLDKFGAKCVLNPALLCIIFGPIIFSLIHNLYFAFGGSLLIGIGSSFGFIGLLFVVSQLFTSNSIYFIFGLGVLFPSLSLSVMQFFAPALIAVY